MRRGRAVLLLTLVVAVGAAAGVGVAWWFLGRTPPPDPLGGEWRPFVTTIAGAGVPGSRDDRWDAATFSDPFAVAAGADGRIYVADAGDANRIRRVETDGSVVTLAGGAGEGWHDAPRGLAAFHTPSGLALSRDGSLFVADTGTHVIRRIDPAGNVTTIAGTGRPGYENGPGAAASFDGPMGLALAADGRLLVADAYNGRIRAMGADGIVTTIAGAGGPAGYADGPGIVARFDTPCGVAVAADGRIYVADTGNGLIRQIDTAGNVTTLAIHSDGLEDVSLFRPAGIAVGRDGRLVVSDRRGRILQVAPDGRARVLAGSIPGFRDGEGAHARLQAPAGIAIDAHGAILVADAGNYLLRRIAPAGLSAPDPPRSPLAAAPGFPIASLRETVLPWPVDPQFAWHEVAGTMGEARGSAGGARDRFHAGVDVQAAPGTVVRAVRGAKVDAPIAANGFGELNESVTIGPFTYVHVRAGRDQRDVSLDPGAFPVEDPALEAGVRGRLRLRRGTRFSLGDPIGTVNRFAHVHLNAGTPGREVNALTLPLAGFVDTVPPTIAPAGVTLYDEGWVPDVLRSRGRLLVRGRVRIVVDAWDRVDGNEPRRRLGLFRLAYQVFTADGAPVGGFEAPHTTIVFDRLPADPRAAQLVYAEGTGITVYGNRRTRFLYVATTRVVDGEATEDFWDTAALAPGPYTLRVIAADAAGNETARDVAVFVYR